VSAVPFSAQELLLFVVVQDVALALLTVGIFWVGVFVARRFFGSRAGYSLGALGLRRPGIGAFAGAALGVLVGLGALVVSVAVNLVTMRVLDSLGLPSENTAQEPLLRGLGEWVSGAPAVAIPAAFLVVAAFVPAVEELVFRGAIFGGLYRLGLRLQGRRPRIGGEKGEVSPRADWIPLVPSALLSSALFATLHFSPPILPALFLFALALSYLYWRTGSILPCIFAHATFNAFPVLIITITSLNGVQLPTS
jgi:membrane protease YdiL (CAAX protease family)